MTRKNRKSGTGTWIRKDKRLAIYLRDDMTCAYCLGTVDADTASLDHVTPYAHGGTNGADNLVTACRSCNTLRSDGPVPAEAVAEVARRTAINLAGHRLRAKALLRRSKNHGVFT